MYATVYDCASVNYQCDTVRVQAGDHPVKFLVCDRQKELGRINDETNSCKAAKQ